MWQIFTLMNVNVTSMKAFLEVHSSGNSGDSGDFIHKYPCIHPMANHTQSFKSQAGSVDLYKTLLEAGKERSPREMRMSAGKP